MSSRWLDDYEQYESGHKTLGEGKDRLRLTRNHRTPNYKTRWPEGRDPLSRPNRSDPEFVLMRANNRTWSRNYDFKNPPTYTEQFIRIPTAHRAVRPDYPYTRREAVESSSAAASSEEEYTVGAFCFWPRYQPERGGGLILPKGDAIHQINHTVGKVARSDRYVTAENDRSTEAVIMRQRKGTRLVKRVEPEPVPLEAYLEDVLMHVMASSSK